MRRTCSLVLAAALAAGCSRAADQRRAADAAMPGSGPIAVQRAVLAGDAPEPPPVLAGPLGLDACIGLALERNRDLRLSVGSAERARLDTTIAFSALYAPRLTASLERSRSEGATGIDRDDRAEARVALSAPVLGFTIAPYASSSWAGDDGEDTTPYAAGYGIAISRRIFALAEHTRLSQQATRADRAYAQAVNQLTLRARRTALEAVRSFLDLQKAQGRLRLREARVEQARISLAGVREGVAAGLKAPIEESNARIELAQSEASLLADRQALASARDRLLSLLDLPQGGELEIAPQSVDAVAPDLPPLDHDLAVVVVGHEELANLRLDGEGLRDDMLIARDRALPQVTASVRAGREYQGTAADELREPEDVVALKLELEMPLDAWGGERAAWSKAERALREHRVRLRDTQDDLEGQVRSLRRRIDSQAIQVSLSVQRLDAERAKFAATEASYRTGRVDNLELTRARESLDRAEVDLLEARIDLVIALAERDALLPRGSGR